MASYFEKGSNNSRTTMYTATGKPSAIRSTFGGNTVAEFPVATMEVVHPSETALFNKDDYGDDPDYDDFSKLTADHLASRMMDAGSDHLEVDAAMQAQQTTPQMFHSKPAEIHSLFADPSMRHTVGTLAGLALNQFGKSISASGNLSKHSSRLVQRGMEAGVVAGNPMNPTGEARNSFGLEPVTQIRSIDSPTSTRPVWHDLPGNEIPKSRLDDARRTVHGLLRPNRSKTSSEQFKALNQLESDRDKPYNPSTDKNAMQIPGME